MRVTNIVLVLAVLFAPLSSMDQRPRPNLESADIEWWPWKKFHVSLTYFPQGQYKERIQLTQAYKNFENMEPDFAVKVPLQTLDLLTTTAVLCGFVLNTSLINPAGDPKQFNQLMITNRPVYTSEQKAPWYLVIKINPMLTTLKEKLTNKWFGKIEQSHIPCVPHFTIGRITSINKPELFLQAITRANKIIAQEPEVSIAFDKKHISLSRAKFPTSLLMLEIDESSPAVKMAEKIVAYLPQAERAQNLPQHLITLSQNLQQLQARLF